MPIRLMGPCKTQSCPNRRTSAGPYCSSCSASGNGLEHDRGSSASRGYGHRWRKLRLMVIRRDPICLDPFSIGCVSASTDADHIIPKQQCGQDIMENLQGLCESCHSRKTLLEQSVKFALPGDDTPAAFTVSGRLIILFTATTAPPEALPIKTWPQVMSTKVWGQGWVKSLEPSPARPRVGHARTLAK
jgi:5-methylcytosine-specific restriction protein A